MIRVFDTSQEGRAHEDRPTTKTRRSQGGQRGIISTLAFRPDGSGVFAAGSYAGSVGVYDYREPPSSILMELHGHTPGSGVTLVRFSPDGQLVFSGARKDGKINCWDLRHGTKVREGRTSGRSVP